MSSGVGGGGALGEAGPREVTNAANMRKGNVAFWGNESGSAVGLSRVLIGLVCSWGIDSGARARQGVRVAKQIPDGASTASTSPAG